jgi:hypothetical protein
VFHFPDGTTVTWKAQKPIKARRDASLRFALADPAGKPLRVEPYMGMLSHAAVLRSDGAVFAHLHPTGNYSMAAQSFFATKLAREVEGDPPVPDAPVDHSAHSMQPGGNSGDPHKGMHHSMNHDVGTEISSLDLPYEFPEPGDYRIWIQFRCAGIVRTAVFDAGVEP